MNQDRRMSLRTLRLSGWFWALLLLLPAVTALHAQDKPKPKPAAAGVRPAAPAQVPGQTVQSAAHKNYWVRRSSNGGYMAAWIETSKAGSRTIKSFTDKQGTIVVVTRKDSSGTPLESAFNFIPKKPVPTGKGADTVFGFTSSVGAPSSSSSLADGLLPAQVPKDLEKALRDLGMDVAAFRQLKAFLEGESAAERVIGAGIFGEQSIPAASSDPFLHRSAGPPGSAPGSAGERFRDGGRASDDGASSGKEPSSSQPGPGEPKDITVDIMPFNNSTEHEFDLNDRSDADAWLHADPVDYNSGTGSTYTPVNLTPHEQNIGIQNEYFNKETGTIRLVRTDTSSTGQTRETLLWEGSLHEVRAAEAAILANERANIRRRLENQRRGGSGPARSPGEEGSGRRGLTPEEWGLLRTTGLGNLIYNSWVNKTQHDFGVSLRQPPRGDNVGRTGSAAPRLGPGSRINRAEPGGTGTKTPKIPIKDPTAEDKFSGRQPVPGPKP